MIVLPVAAPMAFATWSMSALTKLSVTWADAMRAVTSPATSSAVATPRNTVRFLVMECKVDAERPLRAVLRGGHACVAETLPIMSDQATLACRIPIRAQKREH